MREKRVNGKGLDEVMRLLREPFPASQMKGGGRDGVKAFPVEVMEERLNSVVGGLGYDKIVGDFNVTEAGNTITAVVKMTVRLYADDDQVFLTRSAYGGADIHLNDKGNAIAVKSVISSAESDAFKRICSGLGIGIDQLREENFTKNDNGKGSREQASEKVFNVTVLDAWRQGTGLLKTKVRTPDGDGELVIFTKDYSGSPSLDAIATQWIKGKSCTVKALEKEFKGVRQLIFRGFAS